MSSKPEFGEKLRDTILSDPKVVLDDRDVMRALASANAGFPGDNVVDIRGIAIERLETKLNRLEDTHRSVIAAAYDNLAGTNQVHRAVLQLLDPATFDDFLRALDTEITQTLRVNVIRFVLEAGAPDTPHLSPVFCLQAPGFVDDYVGQKGARRRDVTLRQISPETDGLYGEHADWVRSEACILIDLGAGAMPAMLVLGSEDPHQFKATQGTDLLHFFGGVFEKAMRRWLA